jgi:dTDP-4-dehydrorhamnose 3,5-epimerase
MGSKIINDLVITPLKQIIDERGAVFHFLKSDSPSFSNFGEAYFSKIYEGVVKGWKLHKIAQQNFCVPYGSVKIVVFDNRINSSSRGVLQEITLNDIDNYFLLSMPAGLWYSFKCTSHEYAILANIINIKHSPDEAMSLPLETNEIPYEW